jgi:hypothetical protein
VAIVAARTRLSRVAIVAARTRLSRAADTFRARLVSGRRNEVPLDWFLQGYHKFRTEAGLLIGIMFLLFRV